MISWQDFEKIELRAGTVVKAEVFHEARKPALKVWVDLGSFGIKTSSAQISFHYTPDSIINKQVVCVVNFPPKQIGKFLSEILITGFADNENNVVLCSVDKTVPNGARLF